jgi:hypothetical protein
VILLLDSLLFMFSQCLNTEMDRLLAMGLSGCETYLKAGDTRPN